MTRYIFVKTKVNNCEKCCFVEDSVAKCKENREKAQLDCVANCLKINGYYGIVDEEDVNREK